MAKRAWVTGAQGFFGRCAASLLEARGFEVVRLARRPWPDEGHPRREHIPIDVASLLQLAARTGTPDLIFHCAGNGSVARSIEDPAADHASAVATTSALLNVMAALAPHASLIFPSSAAVYGDQGAQSLDEMLAPAPVSPYGRHKLEAENLCRRSGLRTIVIRYFSLYGQGLKKQLFWDLAQKLQVSRPGEPVAMLGTGNETRDFLHAGDAAALALHLYEQAGGGFTLVNGGTGRGLSVHDAAMLLRNALGQSNPLEFTGRASPGAPQHLVADARRAAEMGFTPVIRFEEGIRDYAHWVRSVEGAPHA